MVKIKGGTVIDIVVVTEAHVWVEVMAKTTIWRDSTLKVVVNPRGVPLEVGDHVWWFPESDFCYWTPRSSQDKRHNVQMDQVRVPDLAHPHKKKFSNPVKVL